MTIDTSQLLVVFEYGYECSDVKAIVALPENYHLTGNQLSKQFDELLDFSPSKYSYSNKLTYEERIAYGETIANKMNQVFPEFFESIANSRDEWMKNSSKNKLFIWWLVNKHGCVRLNPKCVTLSMDVDCSHLRQDIVDNDEEI